MATQFEVRPANEALVGKIQREFGFPHFIARTMVSYGIGSVDEARLYLSPQLERDWLDPYIIPGMEEAANRIEAAIRSEERILVFGDFDLDGISATTVLTRGLRALGAEAIPFIPKRFEEGYGITTKALDRVAQYDPDLIVTVDCGISCKAEAEEVLNRGMRLVVTDHHEPGDLTPEGVPVCDPKCSDDCPSDILAGVGVALKMVQVLGGRLGQPYLWRQLIDFATLGTVADLMPLTGENRALVAEGLRKINEEPRPCIAALMGTCKVGDKQITSTNLSFTLVPRLNAAGRMGDADLALQLLMEDDFDAAVSLAEKLEALNDERRRIESELAEIAKAKAAEIYHGQRALVVSGEGWHEGVKGIVASRLVSAYGVPALLFSIEGNEARGSGRSVGQVNLFKAVESCADILIRFGGHEAAVGVTVAVDKLDEFNRRLCAYMDQLPEDSFHPLVKVNSIVKLSELTIPNVEKLDDLAPFGQENMTPCFLAHDVRLTNCRAVGAEKNHLACTLIDGVSSVDAIMFHCDNIKDLMQCDSVVDAAFELQIDEWRGRRNVKCMVKEIDPATSCPALSACLPDEDVDFVKDLLHGELADDGAQTESPDTWNVAVPDADRAGQDYSDEMRRLRNAWRRQAMANPQTIRQDIIKSFIGNQALHEAQSRALALLEQGRNVLTVMGTGRGKSLIFQAYAAFLALTRGQVSLLVYPLRALIADQAFHLTQALDRFGLRVVTLTGESTHDERRRIYGGLSNGSVDLLLTTPEYLMFHADEVAASHRIGFVVIDEVHHMAQEGMSRREAYQVFSSVLDRLGRPTVLACTATAPDDVVNEASQILGIDSYVYDPFDRQNLVIDDKRALRDRDTYLASIVASGEKTVIYVNSRMATFDLARRLRAMVPQMAMQIGFYNAGLTRAERNRMEDLFRRDVMRVLVCTSAFGEGVDIPNIRHVVLYHMPFSEIEFNQMCGRAGRDGKKSWIHLLFGKKDARINEGMLSEFAPSHDTMAQIYRELRRIQRDLSHEASGMADPYFLITDDDLAQRASGHLPHTQVAPRAAGFGLDVFADLGLVDIDAPVQQSTTTISSNDDGSTSVTHRVRVVNGTSKVELTDSVRYREGLGEMDTFARFRDWVLTQGADQLRGQLIRPITPDDWNEEGGPLG